MKLERLVLVAVMLGLTVACTDKKADSGAKPTADTTAPVAASKPKPPGHDAFIRHMHLHAHHLKALNTALEAGDLEAAATPAYWLSRHQPSPGLPDGWGPYVERMRTDGRAVEEATDIASATAAAQRLADNCRACHAANGADVKLY